MTLSKDFVPAFTRLDYLNKHCTFRQYYGQFVTPATVFRVVHTIGKDKIRESTDEHFNDIPLEYWSALVHRLPGSQYFAKAGDYYTQAGGVCLAKEAARQWLEMEGQNSES